MRRFAFLLCPVVLFQLFATARANPAVYEPGLDPDVGFNLTSWHNYTGFGSAVWRSAVQSLYDGGFRSVSINPVRYFDPNTGAIATSSPNGPELADVAAGINLAHSLGMTVTVTPYIEYQGFTQWRGLWGPTPGSAVSNTFWNGYQQYLVDVARVAQANGANFMNVGVELNQLAENAGNNAKWTSAIGAVAANFSGKLGYAANWDDYSNPNLVNNIWQNPHVSNMGVDAYFPLTTFAESNLSGTNPNPAFLALLQSSWQSILDGNLLPFAHSLKGGTGMPVVFPEIGYLPLDGTTSMPYSTQPSNTVDQDEQIMAFKALIAALDHRKATDNLQAVNIWQWGMLGSGGSPFSMDLSGFDGQPNNVPATQYLADYVTHPAPEPSTFVLAALGILCPMAFARRRRFACGRSGRMRPIGRDSTRQPDWA